MLHQRKKSQGVRSQDIGGQLLSLLRKITRIGNFLVKDQWFCCLCGTTGVLMLTELYKPLIFMKVRCNAVYRITNYNERSLIGKPGVFFNSLGYSRDIPPSFCQI